MTTPTDSDPNLLTVIAHLKAAPGKEAQLRRELEALVDPTSKEDGYVNYDLHVSTEDDGTFYLYENWESAEKLDAHLATPHLERFAGILPDLLDENGITIARLRRIA
ncbi:MAG: antibiotic biosynthesis monooxygenase [Actinomycetota bacterium]|nr:antibiotic biosynthesis monooxygenase [Actinomycetota bacterium]